MPTLIRRVFHWFVLFGFLSLGGWALAQNTPQDGAAKPANRAASGSGGAGSSGVQSGEGKDGSRTLKVAAANGNGRRVALVIGNGNYQFPDSLPKLTNPVNDAEDVAGALRGFGFEVLHYKNLNQEGMDQAIAEFGSRIGGSEAALFYYAGHGMQVKNQNYLMPVNSRLESEASVPYQGVNLNRILDEMDNGKSAANILILDACRNNPISGKFRSGSSRGLAAPGSVPRGTVIVFATDPGNVASDGAGRNGLFTAGLLKAFKGTDLSLDTVLTVASAEVEKASNNAQTPYVNGPKTLQKNFSFRTGGGGVLTEQAYWNRIQNSKNAADFEAYLRDYPKGQYVKQAQIALQVLRTPVVAETPRPTVTNPPATVQAPANKPVTVAPQYTPPVPSAVVSEEEVRLWRWARADGSRLALSRYLRSYPQGRFVEEAKQALEALDAREQASGHQRLEMAAWEKASAEGSAQAYIQYLKNFPRGRHAVDAEIALRQMRDRNNAAFVAQSDRGDELRSNDRPRLPGNEDGRLSDPQRLPLPGGPRPQPVRPRF